MGRKRLSESAIRSVVGLVLWAISSMLTAGLFLGFAGEDSVKRAVLLGLAIGLEGAKILSWRRGGVYRVLAVSLICLSALASLGAALETVQSFRKPAVAARSDQAQADLANIDRQIGILVDRLATVPADFTSAARQLNADIEQLRSRRATMTSEQAQQAERSRSDTMFDLIARAIGLPVETVMFIILLFMAANLEVAALLLAGQARHETPLSVNETAELPPTEEPMGPYPIHRFQPMVSTERFLEAAMTNADLPFLHGRETTAKRLGIRSYEAKIHVKALIESGKIVVSGKRLRLDGPQVNHVEQ